MNIQANNKNIEVEVPEGYKKTPVGIIPEDWEEMRLEQVSKIIMGVSPNSENYNFEGQGKFLIQGNADIRNRKSAPRQYTSEITKECQVGDILMSVRAPVGEIAKSIHNACIGRGVCAIRNNKKADGEFLFYYLLNTEVLWSRFKQGSTFESVNSTDIRNFTIQIPPIQEQTAIADCLSTWDKGIEKLSALIASKKEQKKGLMQQLLTGKKRLDGFTEEWRIMKFDEFSNVARGGSPRPINEYITTKENGLNWLRIGDIDENSKYIYTTEEKIRVEGLNKTRLVKKGELILSNSMSFGRPFILKIDTCIHDGWLAITEISELVDREFLYYLISGSHIQSKFQHLAAGSGVRNLNKELVSNMKVKLPSISEQNEIVEILSIADTDIELLEKKLEAFKIQKKGLMQVLLTGQKRLV